MSQKEHARNKLDSEEISVEASPRIDAGSQLREERIRQGITFDEITAAIGVRPLILKAIEENDRASLPAEVFVRGFIKLYADHLGLDSAAILASYAPRPVLPENEDLSSQDSIPDILRLSREAREPLFTLSPARIGWGVAAVLVIVIALYFGGKNRPPPSPLPQGQGVIEAPAPVDQVAPQNETSDIQSAILDQDTAPGDGEAADDPAGVSLPAPQSPVADSPAVTPPSVELPPAGPQPPAAVPSAAPPPDSPPVLQPDKTDPNRATAVLPGVESPVARTPDSPGSAEAETSPPAYVLELNFIEDTWLEVTIDDHPPRDGIYSKGSRRVWTANKRIDLYLGNAGGVELIVNKWNLPKLGPSGKTRRLSIPRDFPGPRP